MSDYRLVVTRNEPNPTFAEEHVKYEESQRYSNGYPGMSGGPSRTIDRQVLDVTLTEAEFIAVKKAAIEAAK